MNVYDLIVFVHVASAVTLLSGSVIASPAVRAAIRRATTVQELQAYLTIGRPLLTLEPVSAMVVLASGVYLTAAANFWTLGWIQIAAVFWLVNAVTAPLLAKPALARLAAEAAVSPDGAVTPQLNELRWSPRWSFAGDVLLANDAASLYVMVMKPTLIPSLLVFVAANLFIATARAIYAAMRQRQPRLTHAEDGVVRLRRSE